MAYKNMFCLLVLVFAMLVSGERQIMRSWSNSTIYSYYTTTQSGTGTYYGAYTNGGHCSLDPSPAFVSGIYATVAIASQEYAESNTCGMCISVTTNGQGSGANPLPAGPVIVYVNNQCPSCNDKSLDFGLSGDGAWAISWIAVDCPVGSSFLQYLFQGSNSYYIKMQVRNARVPVYSVGITSGGATTQLVRTPDNFWEAPNGASFFPLATFTCVIVSVSGDTVTDTITLSASSLSTGTVQFPPSTGLPTSGSAATTTASTATTAKSTTTTSSSTGTTAKSTTTTSSSTATTAKPTTTTSSSTATTAKSTTSSTATTAKSTTTSSTATTAKSTTTTASTATTAKSTTTTTAAATTSTTAKSTTSTTGSTTGSTGTYQVYQNGVFYNSWSSYSWGTYSSVATAPKPYNGESESFSLLEDDYDAIYFHNGGTTFLTSAYKHFQCQLYTTVAFASGSTSLVWLLYGTSGNTIGSQVPVPSAISANAWNLVSISLSGFGQASAAVQGIAIQANIASNTGNYIYVTDCVFTTS